jgi:hypothetical protein
VTAGFHLLSRASKMLHSFSQFLKVSRKFSACGSPRARTCSLAYTLLHFYRAMSIESTVKNISFTLYLVEDSFVQLQAVVFRVNPMNLGNLMTVPCF